MYVFEAYGLRSWQGFVGFTKPGYGTAPLTRSPTRARLDSRAAQISGSGDPRAKVTTRCFERLAKNGDDVDDHDDDYYELVITTIDYYLLLPITNN